MPPGYFPGCSLHATAHEFAASLRAVAERLDLPLAEIEDWNCCGASSAHALSHDLALALPARTLRLAAEQHLDTVLAPCAACFSRLAGAARDLEDEVQRARINRLLDRPYQGGVKVVNALGFFASAGIEKIRAAVQRPLKGKRIACYYGCLLVRPREIAAADDAEQPDAMEAIVRMVGAEPVAWNHRTECCGGGFSLSRRDAVVGLSGRILADAKGCGAEAVVTACPMCHSNLDMRQALIEKTLALDLDLPVLYITQLMGLAMGLQTDALELDRHFVDTTAFGVSLEGAGA